MWFTRKRTMRAAAASAALVIAAAALPLRTADPIVSEALVTDAAGDYDNFAKALQYSLHFYDANMCGPGVEENSRFKWRANCHTYDAEVPLKTMESFNDQTHEVGTNLTEAFIKENYDILNTGTKEGTVDVSGGYHDAGDHVKFGLPEAYAGTTVSWGYYEFPEAYIECGQQEHVETIIRYFCDYFMRCTFRDPKTGEVKCFCYQVGDGDIDHKYWQLPQNDTMNRPAWFATPDNPTTCNVANTAACLLINYLNFKESDPDYAEKCLDYGKALYDFAKKNDKAIADTEQGPDSYYTSSKWEDDYCFAACWLYLITGDNSYMDDMLPYFDFYAPPGYCYCWNDMWNGVGILMGRISEVYKSGKTYTEEENPLGQSDLAIEYMKAAGKNPYEKIDFWGQCAKAYHGYMSGSPGTITPQGYWWLQTWGSCRYNTAAQMMILIYDKYTKGVDHNEREKLEDYGFTEWAKSQMEYILGKNDIVYLETSPDNAGKDPEGDLTSEGCEHGPRCFLVGYDENSAAYPHHRAASGLTKCEDTEQQLYVLFGALSGGPDAKDRHNDITNDWIYNEVTIDYNAACPGAAAGLYLHYKDQYPQSVTPDFPPAVDGGRGSKTSGENGEIITETYAEACAAEDKATDGAGATKVSLRVKSNASKPPQDLSVRYYFDMSEFNDNISLVKTSILYDQVATEAAPGKTIISEPKVWDKDPHMGYVELTWSDYNFVNCGKKVQFTLGFYYGAKWDPTNDPSYQMLKIGEDSILSELNPPEVRNDYICIYDGGVLIGGTEPDGTKPDTGTTTTTESTSVNPVSAKKGDADCNGEVELRDAILLAKATAGLEELSVQGKKNSDCNDDGAVKPEDLQILLKYLAGAIDTL